MFINGCAKVKEFFEVALAPKGENPQAQELHSCQQSASTDKERMRSCLVYRSDCIGKLVVKVGACCEGFGVDGHSIDKDPDDNVNRNKK